MKHINRYIPTALLGLWLGISSCQQKDEFVEHAGGKGTVERYSINLDSARRAGPDPILGHTVSVRLVAEANDEDLRAMGIDWVARTGTDYKGEAYVNEVKPSLTLTKGEGINVFLTLVKVVNGKADPQSVFSQNVVFTVDAAQGGKYSISYAGQIAMPTAYPEYGGESKEEWYVMGMMGASPTKDLKHYRIAPNSILGRQNVEANTGIFAHSDNGNYPFGSNWVPLTVRSDQSTGRLVGVTDTHRLQFKPLGVFLQLDLGTPILTHFDSRYEILVSNAVDFYGDYDFSADAIVQAFEQKDTNGVGLPKFVSDINKYQGFLGDFYHLATQHTLYTEQGADYPLSSAERSFPWDMPSAQYDVLWNTKNSSNTGLKTLTQGSLGQGSWLYSIRRAYASQTQRTWTANSQFGIGNTDRHIIWYWVRPKDVAPAEPYTYIFSSYFPKEGGNQTRDAFPTPDGFIPQDRVYDVTLKLEEIVADVNFAEGNLNLYKQKEAELRGRGDTSSPTYEYIKNNVDAYQNTYNDLVTRYQSLRTAAFIADSTKLESDYMQRYLRHQGVRAQQIIPIYQTNYSFHQAGRPLSNKVVHAHALMVNDLTISEVHYHKVNGVNYSAVEISNRSNLRLDLSNYALVRMRENATGNGFAFIKEDGSLTDRVTEAQIYPFGAIRRGETNPLVGFPAFSSANTRSFATDKRTIVDGMGLEQTARAYWPNSNTYGEYAGKPYSIANIVDTDMPGMPLTLTNGQTFVFGASGYNTAPVNESTAWWRADYKDILYRRFRTDNTLHAFVGYNDAPAGGSATLDMEVGDAFALIKKTDDLGGWQIIDATGPIGSKGYAFSGSYADYKKELATKGITSTTTRYTMYRDEDVVFPFIFPYRTRKVTTLWSDDWTMEAETPGKLGQYLSVYEDIIGYNTVSYLKRTPWSTDPRWIESYKKNRPVHK